ncbi:class I SAM-dependent methyltransferase [Arcobacter arenosus]|uniref:SAM-dependent methyltransferase n=1 Tax=Arcobacter arenosus TaxID=2576037 RepID=A0A5R8XZY0_9BACT|nr:class I SAM-dependent methyltransferase [Arcobacter arenosus]TLP37561.1 SAM-dependent methyltransferase [Arcobacter arenosus]
MDLETLKNIIEKNLEDKCCEMKRVFHGRGNFYDGFNFLTVDSIDKILFTSFFEKVDEEKEIIDFLEKIAIEFDFKTFIVQRRYEEKAPSDIIFGEVKSEEVAIENGLKYSINFSNKNIGIFPDMKIGREFVKENSKEKNVLNLFSYTCAFSVCAIEGGAKQVVNVDMSKGALSIGRKNHHLNNHDTKKVKFMPYNILKSWSRIKKEAPYDLIIIDPPSFQKGSFAATKDYEKIIKRLDDLASKECIVLSCLNAPELDTNFILNLFSENAPSFKYLKKLQNMETFKTNNEDKSLKNLIFEK